MFLGFVSAGVAVSIRLRFQQTNGKINMSVKGYIFAELTVTDPAVFFEENMTRVESILKKFGASFLVATDAPEVIEGERVVPRLIILEFSSVDKARQFYFSPEYEDIIDFRFKSSSTHLYLLKGVSIRTASAGRSFCQV